MITCLFLAVAALVGSVCLGLFIGRQMPSDEIREDMIEARRLLGLDPQEKA